MKVIHTRTQTIVKSTQPVDLMPALHRARKKLSIQDKTNTDKSIEEIQQCGIRGISEDGALEILYALGKFFSEEDITCMKDLYPKGEEEGFYHVE